MKHPPCPRLEPPASPDAPASTAAAGRRAPIGPVGPLEGLRLLALTGLLHGIGLLAGCASGPTAGPAGDGAQLPAQRPAPSIVPPDRAPGRAPDRTIDRDGPGLHPPPGLASVPDAQPRLETVRPGGPNKPYEVLGQPYTPLAGDPVLVERGLASWYGRKFHGRSTANGETYNMYAMTAAHKTMPLPSYARVRNPANGREVVVRVNDRGPFHANRVIDLSYTAALKLGVLGGVAPVEIERITYEAIRSGRWRPPDDAATAMLAQAAAHSEPQAPARPASETAAEAVADQGAGPATGPAADPIAEIARRSGGQPVLPITAAAAPTPRPLPTPLPLPIETTAPAQPATHAARGFWLQLGAFGQREGAVGFQQRVAREAGWLAPLMTIFNERQLHRLQAGPYASRADAHGAARRLRDTLQLVPAIVERR